MPTRGQLVADLQRHRVVGVLTEHCLEELDLLHDAFSKMLILQPYLAVGLKRHAELKRLFDFYSAEDQSSAKDRKALTTMNMSEMAEMCEDAKIYDNSFGVRDMVSAFVRVNIEDDIYIQDDKKNTSTELVYDEFFECIARMHFSIFLNRPGQASYDDDAQLLLDEDEGLGVARKFDAWLESILLPNCFAAIKDRKKR